MEFYFGASTFAPSKVDWVKFHLLKFLSPMLSCDI